MSEKVVVVVEMTREEARSGFVEDGVLWGPLKKRFADAIRAALAREGEPRIGWQHEYQTHNPIVQFFPPAENYTGLKRVLVIDWPEGGK